MCERGVSVRLRSWCAATMAGTPLVAVVACCACYTDQGNISVFGWAIVDRSRRLKKLAQVTGGAFLWLESEFGDMAVSPNCILWFGWKYLVCVCKESLHWCFEWALMSRCLLCVHVWLGNVCESACQCSARLWIRCRCLIVTTKIACIHGSLLEISRFLSEISLISLSDSEY